MEDEECYSLLPCPTVLSCCVGCNRFLQHHQMFEKKQCQGNKRIGRQRHFENTKCSGGMSRPWVPRQLLGLEPTQDSFLYNMLKAPVGSVTFGCGAPLPPWPGARGRCRNSGSFS